MMPPRPARMVLCVDPVTKSATPTGEACSPVATRPVMWAMSAVWSAPTASAASWMRSHSTYRGYAENPETIMSGSNSSAISWRES